VRYVCEPIAAVFATDPYVAEDAADLVAIEIEDLPVLLDAAAPPAEFSSGHSTEAAIGRHDAARDILELHGAAKVPHRIRELLALMLRRPQSSIHDYSPMWAADSGCAANSIRRMCWSASRR
jgi:aerobic carbon-monoxide dehydrogenase large subunit